MNNEKISEQITSNGFMDSYYPDWPPREYYLHEKQITKEQIDRLKALIANKAKEREIDAFISDNPVVLTIPLDFFRTGHHGGWVVPKKAVRSRVSQGIPGLIPDFLIGGRSSMGFTWMVIELKGAGDNLFSKVSDKIYFSKTANQGICQLLEYIDFCSKSQANIRDSLRLTDFREPTGLMIIGTESEFDDPRKRDLKSAWNRKMGSLEIRSYDALLRTCESIYESYNAAK